MNKQETQLAQEGNMAQMVSLNGRTQILVRFRLAEQLYAVPIDYVDQIVEMVTIVPLPQGSHTGPGRPVQGSVEGVINVRGTFVPVINLRHHLGLPGIVLGLDIHIILVDVGGRKLGLLVDRVVDVFGLTQALSRPGEVLPASLGELGLLSGLAHTEEGLMFVLDLEQIFDPSRVTALPQAFDTLPELVETTGAAASKLVTEQIEQGV
jgi:purine-binding chemotaxis protein CheW